MKERKKIINKQLCIRRFIATQLVENLGEKTKKERDEEIRYT